MDIEKLQRQCEVLRAERDHARAKYDRAVQLLLGIHSLMYPPPITIADGRTMVFRPTDPDPHTILQELSDRIRALSDELRDGRQGLLTDKPVTGPACNLQRPWEAP